MSDAPIAIRIRAPRGRAASRGCRARRRCSARRRCPGCCCSSSTIVLVGLAEFGPWASIGQFVAPLLQAGVRRRLSRRRLDAGARRRAEVRAPLPRLSQRTCARCCRSASSSSAACTVAVMATVARRWRQADLDCCPAPSGRAKRCLSSGRVQAAMLFGAACALPTLLATLVRAGAGRVPGRRRAHRAGDEPARRARQLAPDRRLRACRVRLRRRSCRSSRWRIAQLLRRERRRRRCCCSSSRPTCSCSSRRCTSPTTSSYRDIFHAGRDAAHGRAAATHG